VGTTSSSVVAVMMPAHNAAAHIAQAIDSLVAQTHPHWRLTVVDDGSTDDTATIAARYNDPRIAIVRRANGGEGAARNTALEHVTGTYLAFLDADDAWLPEHLATATSYLDAHPEDVGVYSDGYHITETGARLKPLSARRRGPMTGRIFDEVVRGSDVFGPPVCVVLRLDPIQRHRLRFDESLPIGTDWDFLRRMADLGAFGYVDRLTCLYRVHQSNVTSRVGEHRRARALAACRMNAISHPAFGTCPEDVRANVFYDLLAVQLRDDPERQDAVLGWPQFAALSRPQQARLLRLTASKAILHGTSTAFVRQWLRRSRQANPADVRGRLVALLYAMSPSVCRTVLHWHTRGETDPRRTPPLADLGAQQISPTH
jgi:glycosyltransferase involved in cell wall biosynthesis